MNGQPVAKNSISYTKDLYTVKSIGRLNMNEETKRKTSISVDRHLWQKWIKFVVDKTGSSRMISIELENAIKEYMKNHGVKES
jgi:hypothetical protein